MTPATGAPVLGGDVSALLDEQIRVGGARPAVTYPVDTRVDGSPGFRTMTYAEFGTRVRSYAAGFERIGITAGVKTIVMVRPEPDLFAVLFALFRVGAVPVVVDPGMGLRRMLHCFRSVGAEAFVGIPEAHLVRLAYRRTFATVRVHVTAGRSLWGGHTLASLRDEPPRPQPVREPGDLLMIAFTTGSTGPAKGVEFTRAGFAAALTAVAEMHGRAGQFVSLTSVPLFGIFDLLQGAHVVLGPVDPVKVASADPALLTQVARRFGATDLTASPALLTRLGAYLAEESSRLPDLVRVISMGAPANLTALAQIRAALGPDARVFTTYGATEALPVSTLEWAELDATRPATADGAGVCVGTPWAPGELDDSVRLITVGDEPVEHWHDDLRVPPGTVGEIVACGGQVSRAYHRNPEADAKHKIHETTPDGKTRVWHRLGDLARFDEQGRLWFCGRLSQRVRTAAGDLYTVQCEQILNTHPDVARTALVGIGEPGRQIPVVCFETRDGVTDVARLQRELWQLARTSPLTGALTVFLPHPGFPVDIRHNAKIGREELALWAAATLGHTTTREGTKR
ncbi:fatty acid CoA ligase family protein [Nocardia thailandica]